MADEMRKLINQVLAAETGTLDEVFVGENSANMQVFREGKWIDGRFPGNIRIDRATYGAGEDHAHIYGRKGNELGVVKVSGTGSHGTMMTLHADDADALRKKGFNIRPDNIVEWIVVGTYGGLFLLG